MREELSGVDDLNGGLKCFGASPALTRSVG
jgi:hypothetical protein